MMRAAEARAYNPDRGMPWIRPATRAALRACASAKPDVIWATAGPVSSFVVAQRISRRTGIPYVLDFRDAWTITHNRFEASRPPWAVRADRLRMYRLLQGASAITFRYRAEAECYRRAYPGAFEASRVHIIPNGFEGGISEFDVPKGEACTLLYTGTLESYRYDSLLRAVRMLLDAEPEWATQLRVVFVGEETGALKREAGRLRLEHAVSASDPLPFGAVTELQRRAHAMLVLGRPSSMRGHELFAGAKLFGYLKAGRPIVGVLPSDETRRILEEVGVSTLADAESCQDIAAVLRRVLIAWSEGRLRSMVPDPGACAAYSAERQTAALVRVLERRPMDAPFVPGAATVPPSLEASIGEHGWIREVSLKGRDRVLLYSR
jgi:hypothetical protein